ncbi:MAG: sulfolactaldehyde 3-reductase [Hyphomicrobiales bacterium]|nr:sulfolactaldehyde 3-reductase [Hyphomicrobiales bacterium]
MAKVGFVGLGQMGTPMSRNLARAGHQLSVFDLAADAMDALVAEGAERRASPADAARDAEFVFTMLPVGLIVEQAVFGDDGIAEGISAEALYIDMSTILPQETIAIGARLAEQGIPMIDAPVGRTSAQADTGTVVFMVGGDDKDIDRARPLLEIMGEMTIKCGPLGSAAAVKLVNNYITTVSNLTLAEGFALAQAAGVNLDALVEVISNTPAGRGHLQTTWPDKALKDDPSPAFMVDLAHKDLGLALEMAASLNVPAATGAAGRQIYSLARSQGRGGDDWTTGILRTLRALSGLND